MTFLEPPAGTLISTKEILTGIVKISGRGTAQTPIVIRFSELSCVYFSAYRNGPSASEYFTEFSNEAFATVDRNIDFVATGTRQTKAFCNETTTPTRDFPLTTLSVFVGDDPDSQVTPVAQRNIEVLSSADKRLTRIEVIINLSLNGGYQAEIQTIFEN